MDTNPTTETDSEQGRDVLFDPNTQLLLDLDETNPKTFRRSIVAAALFHLGLLLINIPNLAEPVELRKPGEKKVYVVQALRFQPPPAPRQSQPPKPKAKKIPIPDPTPDEPEPILRDEIDEPEVELTDLDPAIFGIPEAPPANIGPQGILQVGDGVTAPVKVYAPQPQYSEEARQARIQGTVILQAVIDNTGAVDDVQVLKGLPMGLDLKAIEAVQQWKFKPALHEGKPVAVYLSLLINFSLQ